MNCPRDGHLLEFVSGDFPTGVEMNGYQEVQYEEGWQCPMCETIYDESDMKPPNERN